MTTIVFAHGLESDPIGRKSQAIIDAGYHVIAPDGRGLDLGARIPRILEALEGVDPPPVLVGSSFGGIGGLIAAIMASERGMTLPGLVLCAPALMLPPPPQTVAQLSRPTRTIIIHGTRDDIIPIDVSRAFAREHGAELREVDDDHRLSEAGLPPMLEAVAELAGPPK
ncbi:MAG: alpha/beta fold hydrolase [Myxococcota bacterium]